MNVILRSDHIPDVAVSSTQWEYCNLDKLDQHIRTLQAARRWLIQEREASKANKPEKAK